MGMLFVLEYFGLLSCDNGESAESATSYPDVVTDAGIPFDDFDFADLPDFERKLSSEGFLSI